MFIDTAHHHYRLRLEIDAFVGAAINITWDSSGAWFIFAICRQKENSALFIIT